MDLIIKGTEKLFKKVISPIVITVYIVMILSLFLQVLTRYVFQAPLIWTEEVGIHSFIWLLFLSAGIAFIPDVHIRVTFVMNSFPEKIRFVLDIILRLAVLFCLLLIIIYGFRYADLVSYQRTYSLRISKIYPVLAVPVGSLCMFLGVVHSILIRIKDKLK